MYNYFPIITPIHLLILRKNHNIVLMEIKTTEK